MTHVASFVVRQLHSAYAAAWPQIVADVQQIIDACANLGIVIAGPDGTGDPQVDLTAGIVFNGDADTDANRTPLRLPPPLPSDGLWPTGTAVHFQVDTDGGAYDIAVRVTLLRLLHHAGDAFALADNNDGIDPWAEAILMHSRLFGGLSDRVRSLLYYATHATAA
ncbi:hypothetical protein [Catellatospora methionotrophica]|uniref:hypothetical protein n=1 Tax=Catellatospora methionotrophica TaxID=121620 RepID=UPI0033DFBD81